MFCNKYSFLTEYSKENADCSKLPPAYRVIGGFGTAISFIVGVLL